MPLAQESIITPGAVNSRAPLKKSTVVWIGVAILALAALGVVAPMVFTDSSNPAPVKAPEKEAPIQAGRAQTIDSEFEDARRRKEREVAEKARRESLAASMPVVPVPVPAGNVSADRNPVPVEARRTNSSAAFYDRPGSRQTQQSGGSEDREYEIDSAGRASKSLALDDGDSSFGKKDETVDDRLRAMLPQAAPAPAGTNDLAGSGSRSALDALLKAQSAQPMAVAQSADRAWLKEYAAEKKDSQNKPLKPYAVSSPYTLLQGKVMPAVLMRNINTDLPGELSACLTLDVYDSISSNYLLMPKGTCLVGQYSSSVRPGQSRVLFAFNRIILPSGLSFDLPAAPGSDMGGASGVEGSVNNHFFRMFTSSFLVAWLADRAERNAPAGTSIGSTGGAKTAAGQVLVDTSRTILDRDKLIAPTITVAKGERINIEVTQDMEFPGPYRK